MPTFQLIAFWKSPWYINTIFMPDKLVVFGIFVDAIKEIRTNDVLLPHVAGKKMQKNGLFLKLSVLC